MKKQKNSGARGWSAQGAVELLENRALLSTVTGHVTSLADDSPFENATIQLKGTSILVLTDDEGAYAIDVPSESSVLIVNANGQETQELEVGIRTTVDVQLDEDFNGLPDPPTAVAGTYSALSGTSISLSAAGSSDPNPSETLTYTWDLDGDGVFGESGGAATHGVETGSSPTFFASGLSGGTNFTVRLHALNTARQTSVASGTVAIASLSAPTSLQATGYSSSQVNLTWTDNSVNETSYLVEQWSDVSSSWVLLDTLSPNASSYSDTGLTEAASYQYRVSAKFGTNTSSATVNGYTRPETPSDLAADTLSTTEIELTWVDNSDGESGYKVWASEDGTTFSVVTTLTADSETYDVSGLTAGTGYIFYVAALNGSVPSIGSEYAAAVTVPSAPTATSQPTVSTSSTTGTTISWTTSAVDAVRYLVERSNDSGTTWELVGDVESETLAGSYSFNDDSVIGGTSYIYQVTAEGVGASTTSTSSSSTTAVAPSSPSETPGTPTPPSLSLSSNSTNANQVDITYTVSQDSYFQLEVKRSPSDDINFHTTGTVDNSIGTHTVTVTRPPIGCTDTYRLRAEWDGLVKYGSTYTVEAVGEPNTEATLPAPENVRVSRDPETDGPYVRVTFEGDYGDSEYSETMDTEDYLVEVNTYRADDPYHALTDMTDGNSPTYLVQDTPGEYYFFILPDATGQEYTTRVSVISKDTSEVSEWADVNWTSYGDAGPTVNVSVSQPSSSQVTVSWTGDTNPDHYVDVYLLDGDDASPITSASASDGSVSIAQPVAGRKIFAVVNCGHPSEGPRGEGNYSNIVDGNGAVPVPAAPTQLTARIKPTGNNNKGETAVDIRLVWDNVSNNEQKFVVQRATNSAFNQNVKEIESEADKPFAVDKPDAKIVGAALYYRVKAVGQGGSSGWSNVFTTSSTPVYVGFYGANVLGAPLNGGNESMLDIGKRIQSKGMAQRTFRSLDVNPAFDWLLKKLDLNNDGKYDPTDGDQTRTIMIYGHSWGGTTAAQLAQKISTSNAFENKSIAVVAMLDPVKALRFTSGWIPDNVGYFWNRYQTKGEGVSIGPVPVHGGEFTSYAQQTSQQNVNGSSASGTDHWSIITEYEDQMLGVLNVPL